ncbi:MAG: hypothetical protein U0T32_12450 [Chitinophagales bacterium]|jgi:hypothetical protein
MHLKPLYLIIGLLWLTSFTQKKEVLTTVKTVKGNKHPICFFIAFNYDSLLVNDEKEIDFVKRTKDERNAKKPGKGDRWEENWYRDKKEVYEKTFIDGVYAKLSPKAAVKNDKSICVYTMEVMPLFMMDGYFKTSTALKTLIVQINVRDSSGTIVLQHTANPIPTYLDGVNTPALDPGVKISDSYFLCGKEAAKKVNKLIDEAIIK